jgi:hypothetical protein
LKEAIAKQIYKHFFFPVIENEESIEGSANVTFQVLPEGNVQVLLVQTGNSDVRKLIECRAAKIKVSKDLVVAGEIFQFRIIFKARE